MASRTGGGGGGDEENFSGLRVDLSPAPAVSFYLSFFLCRRTHHQPLQRAEDRPLILPPRSRRLDSDGRRLTCARPSRGKLFFYENLRKHFGSHIYSVQTSQDYRNRHPEENKKLCAFIITKNENKRNRKGAGLVLHHTLPKGLAASIWGQRLGCGMSFLFFCVAFRGFQFHRQTRKEPHTKAKCY